MNGTTTYDQKISEFLSRYFRKYQLQRDEDIYSLGYVNSLFAMQLVMFIENEFHIRVENEDLDLDNFRSIASIASFISRKLNP